MEKRNFQRHFQCIKTRITCCPRPAACGSGESGVDPEQSNPDPCRTCFSRGWPSSSQGSGLTNLERISLN